MVNADRPQGFRAPALEKLQISGMINNPGKIRVFVIDADGYFELLHILTGASYLFRTNCALVIAASLNLSLMEKYLYDPGEKDARFHSRTA